VGVRALAGRELPLCGVLPLYPVEVRVKVANFRERSANARLSAPVAPARIRHRQHAEPVNKRGADLRGKIDCTHRGINTLGHLFGLRGA
jgi:hypothetical protein